MSARLEKLFNDTRRQRRGAFAGVLAGLIVVPLAVAGLFSAALSTADERLDTLPAIVVNNDEFVTITDAAGADQMVLAGRLLVTELTAPAAPAAASAGTSAAAPAVDAGTGFSWTISNSADAAKALAAGEAYAVLTIPEDFSASITSVGGGAPVQANLSIHTDDAHSYLAGSAAQAVGSALTSTFGRAISEQYLTTLYGSLSELGTALVDAADGGAQLSSGVSGVATGLDSLADGTAGIAAGAADAASGASTFSSGVSSYTGGVDSLSSGLGSLNTGAGDLTALSAGVAQYTAGVSASAAGFEQLRAAILANPDNAAYAGALADLQAGLDTLSGQGAVLSDQTASALSGVQGGISQSASGAAQLAAGSDGLRTGASGLAGGISELSDGLSGLAAGTAEAATGARQLETGASALAEGLATGAEGASVLIDTDAEATAAVVSEPVTLTNERENALASIGPVLGMIFVPVGLWIGVLAIFLALRPLSAFALASTTSTGRLVSRGLFRAFGIAAAQAAVVVVLLHTTLGLSWSLAPATAVFAIFLAFVFTAVHHLLTVAFGRAGLVASLLLLALQLVSVGGLYPIELVAAPFRAISPFLPLTWAVQGMQAIISSATTGASAGADIFGAVGILTLFALGSVLLTYWTVARRRGARSFGLAVARA